MLLGIDRLLLSKDLQNQLKGKRLGFLGHPASTDRMGRHSFDQLNRVKGLNFSCAFGPQHGMKGDKQDNMIESDDYMHPEYKIPVYSLYGTLRYPSNEMMEAFDVLLVDMQDLGTRIYTFVTTLCYMLDACAKKGKTIWILDRPNPAGRPVEGSILPKEWTSFIGIEGLIMRHGLSLGEIAKWYIADRGLNLEYQIIQMLNYSPKKGPGFGWPASELSWINPSPNASGLNMARAYPGTVLFEGTTLSEGRGTSVPLEIIGAPDIDFKNILKQLEQEVPELCESTILRHAYFEPTFHKHSNILCEGIQFHTLNAKYKHRQFKPYRLNAMILKLIRKNYPDYKIWHELPYEYETEKLAIDLLAGGTYLREWVDDPSAGFPELDILLMKEERKWRKIRKAHLLY